MPPLNQTRSRACTIVKNKHISLSIDTPGGIRQKHDRWPHAHHILTRWPSRPDCSPYEVLEQPRNGAYSKRRFYELVMVYHPDRWVHGTYHGIPKETRVERYRLILAANAILSDPVRRKAYDEHGVGWTAGGNHSSRRRQTQTDRPEKSASSGASCHWQQQPSGRKQRPIFMRNGSFAVMLLCFATSLSCLLWLTAFYRAESISKRQNFIQKQLMEELDSIASRRYQLD
ncbi:hypothetical protein PpBr36_02658 [Pyricularia pennisetigena]|uniref:hypothetical protein n=1 Tax=Pyricularia pennisetigena TaxID=1578925 RepID=UPI00114F37DF|nr:hypothetical protein PpBr36_02658 [Pyricularia pennisetigena]TLS30091.1 hypothetical protein PpBr36_02658 [Pyricularia pennisetigena]